MQSADTITIKHDNDTVTTYTNASYTHDRGGVTVMTSDGIATHSDVADFQAVKKQRGKK
jgi:hypothetical protein